MSDHSQRAHATWSASATARNWACAGALALGATVERLDVESEAAAWGTAAHQVAEFCLRRGCNADDLIGQTEKTKRHSFVVDEEMADTAQQYIDYVVEKRGEQDWLGRRCPKCNGAGRDEREISCGGCAGTGEAHGFRNALFIEQRFSLAKLSPPFDAGGTCDAIIYNPDEKLLEVVDLKGGRGVVVEVTENKQLRTYALGALLAHPDLDVALVKSTIVQPRAQHKDGRIRSETYHVADLMEWTAELMARMRASKQAEAELADVKGELMREAWADKYIVAGDHCKFCPAEGICPAREKQALAVANAFFTDVGAVAVRNQPSELDPERIAKVLDGADALTDWLNAVRALAQRMAETGTEVPGYYLVDKVGHRKWKSADPSSDLALLGLTMEHIYEQKLRSPAGVEKKLGSKRAKELKDRLANIVERPVTGRSLVSKAKSTKPAAKPVAEAFFGTAGALS